MPSTSTKGQDGSTQKIQKDFREQIYLLRELRQTIILRYQRKKLELRKLQTII